MVCYIIRVNFLITNLLIDIKLGSFLESVEITRRSHCAPSNGDAPLNVTVNNGANEVKIAIDFNTWRKFKTDIKINESAI